MISTRPNLVTGRGILNCLINTCQNYSDLYKDKTVAIIRFKSCPNLHENFVLASEISTLQKVRALNNIGFRNKVHLLECDILDHFFKSLIEDLNSDIDISAILIQMPVPDPLKPFLKLINAEKDIDNLSGLSEFKSCATAESILRVVNYYVELKRSTHHKVAIVGGRGFVGRGVASLLDQNKIDTFIVEKEDNLELILDATIVVSATGNPKLLDKRYLKVGQMAVDAGFCLDDTSNKRRVIGDINRNCYAMLDYVTPVPNGIGPLNISVILERLIKLSCNVQIPNWKIFDCDIQSVGI